MSETPEMKHFIGVKLIQATAMALGEYNIHRGWTIPENEDPNRPGYLVVYPDGYQSWSPTEVFESAYMELNDPSKITEEDLDRFIGDEKTAIGVGRLDEKTTLVKIVPRTGFVQYDFSSCVDPKNYDENLGVSICVNRIRNRLWPLLGFVLQWAKDGLKPLSPAQPEPADKPQE